MAARVLRKLGVSCTLQYCTLWNGAGATLATLLTVIVGTSCYDDGVYKTGVCHSDRGASLQSLIK